MTIEAALFIVRIVLTVVAGMVGAVLAERWGSR